MTRARNIAGFSTITTTPSPVHVGPIGVLTATRIDGEFNVVDIATRDLTAQGIGVTNLQVSGITTGLNVSGIITAQNGINFNGTSTGLNVSGVGTIATLSVTGNATVGGVLTYEDVTRVDSVGVVTAREQVHVGTGVSIAAGGLNVTAGISTFGGDVSIADKIIHTGDTNTAIRFPAADTITAETGGSERARIDSSGRLLKSGESALTSTSLNHPIQVAAASDATSIAIFGRSADDIGELDFYENDKSTKLGEIQYRQDHANIRHRVGYLAFATGGVTERLRIDSDGRLLLGTTTEGSAGADEFTINTASGHGGMTIRNDTSSNGNIWFSDGTSGAAEYAGYVQYAHDGDHLKIGVGGAERLRIDSSGNVNITGITTTGNYFNSVNGYRVANHPIAGYASFTDISGGSYATRLGSTGTSTLRSTQIYGGGGHLATFDGVNIRLGINTTTPNEMLDIYNNSVNANAKARICSANGGQAGLELIAGSGSVDRASRIDFINMNDSSSPQWTLINDYQQNGTNDFGIYHGSDKAIVANPDADVQLMYNGTTRFYTTSTGAYVNGNNGNIFVASCSTNSTADVVFQNTEANNAGDMRLLIKTAANQGSDPYIKFDAGGSDMIVGTHYLGTTNNQLRLGAGTYVHTVNGIQIDGNGNVYMNALNSGSGASDLRYNTSSKQVFYDSSSRLVKTDIEDLSYGLDAIKQLKPRIYKRTDTDGDIEIGFIADEVVNIIPEIVPTAEKSLFTKNEEDTEIVPSYVEYKRLTAVLTKAVQELSAEVEQLKSQLNN